MKSKILIIFILTLISIHCLNSQNIIIADLDKDGLSDTTYIDTTSFEQESLKAIIVCKLSSKRFEPIYSLPTYYDRGNSNSRPLNAGDINFWYSTNGMRAGQEYEFSYESSTGKIRLISSYIFSLGNVVGDGSQEIIIDLVDGTIRGETCFFDYMNEEIISTPINEKKDFKAIYLEEFSSDLELW